MTDFTYQAFGHAIRSCIELPELRAELIPPRKAIRVIEGKVNHGDAPMGWNLCDGEVVLWWKGVASFAIQPGQITLCPAAESRPEMVRLALLGPVLAAALQMAGYLVLHGNAVQIGGLAVVLAGQKGSGKSTLTAALLARGRRLLSDDVVALRQESDGTFVVLSGFPAMKLWPDSLARCGGFGSAVRRPLAPGSDKLYLRLGAHQFTEHPARLAAIWMIERGTIPGSSLIAGTEAFRQMVLHSYCSRYGQTVFHGPAAAAHLFSCSALLGTVGVEMLRRTDDFSSLDALVALIERKVAAVGDGGSHAV